MKTANSSQGSMIWAIDPLLNNTQKLKNAKKAIQVWQKKKNLKVMPVSLLFPEDLYLPISVMAPWGEKLQALTEDSVKPLLKSLHIKNMAEPGVVMSSSKNESIDDFIKYAKSQNAQMIIASTHEKTGTEKNRIGKFTQKLIEKSPIPVLSIKPSSEVPGTFSRILFPTDFSKSSEKSFKTLVGIAKGLRAQIIVYHNIYDPVLPAAEFTGIPATRYEVITYYTHQMERTERARVIRWKKYAESQGVDFEYKGERASYSLSKSILNAARKAEVHMIALGIESHPYARAFVGSSTREVIGASSKPVLIINSRVQNKRTKK